MVNVELLNKTIDSIGIPKAKLCSDMSMSRQTLDYKLKKGNFLIGEAFLIRDLLRLTDAEFNEIFFH